MMPYARLESPVAPGQVITCPTPSVDKCEAYKAKSSHVLGWLQLATTAVLVGIQITGDVTRNRTFYDKYFPPIVGYVCAPFFIISGALSIAAGMNKQRSVIVGNLTMSIFSLCFAFILMCVEAGYVSDNWMDDIFDDIVDIQYREKKATFAMVATMLALSLFMITLTLWTSVISGQVVCCAPSVVTRTFISTTTVVPGSTTLVQQGGVGQGTISVIQPGARPYVQAVGAPQIVSQPGMTVIQPQVQYPAGVYQHPPVQQTVVQHPAVQQTVMQHPAVQAGMQQPPAYSQYSQAPYMTQNKV